MIFRKLKFKTTLFEKKSRCYIKEKKLLEKFKDLKGMWYLLIFHHDTKICSFNGKEKKQWFKCKTCAKYYWRASCASIILVMCKNQQMSSPNNDKVRNYVLVASKYIKKYIYIYILWIDF
jgi:hypothetical protein